MLSLEGLRYLKVYKLFELEILILDASTYIMIIDEGFEIETKLISIDLIIFSQGKFLQGNLIDCVYVVFYYVVAMNLHQYVAINTDLRYFLECLLVLFLYISTGTKVVPMLNLKPYFLYGLSWKLKAKGINRIS